MSPVKDKNIDSQVFILDRCPKLRQVIKLFIQTETYKRKLYKKYFLSISIVFDFGKFLLHIRQGFIYRDLLGINGLVLSSLNVLV